DSGDGLGGRRGQRGWAIGEGYGPPHRDEVFGQQQPGSIGRRRIRGAVGAHPKPSGNSFTIVAADSAFRIPQTTRADLFFGIGIAATGCLLSVLVVAELYHSDPFAAFALVLVSAIVALFGI